jgi:hypothetical protein
VNVFTYKIHTLLFPALALSVEFYRQLGVDVGFAVTVESGIKLDLC